MDSPDLDAIAHDVVMSEITYRRADGTAHTSYEPCYFDRGYSDTDDSVMSALVSGDDSWRDIAYERLGGWDSEAVWNDACDLADQYLDSLEEEARDSIDRDALVECVYLILSENVTQDIALEWVQNMRPPLLRVEVGGCGEGDMIHCGDDTDVDVAARELASRVGLDFDTQGGKLRSIVREAWYRGAYRSTFLVFQADVAALSGDGDTLIISGEVELWACNPWRGDGWSETITLANYAIPRANLRTEYEYCEVFGTLPGYLPVPSLKLSDSTDAAA